MPPADNTQHLRDAVQRRSQQARRRAEDAITKATKKAGPVSVVGIARAAGVSRSWIYTQPDLISAITQLQQRPRSAPPAPGQPASVESLRGRLDATLERNKHLRDQVADLTERLEAAYGEIRRLRTHQPQH